MATGRRRWGRRLDGAANATLDGHGAGAPRFLRTLDELMRSAHWPYLPHDQRAALLRLYTTLPASAPKAEFGLIDESPRVDEQEWLVSILAPHLQPTAVSVIRSWLENSPPNTHLYAVGAAGRGRTSTVVALARRAMASVPPGPEYCYVPDPQALGHTRVLALPGGTGLRFVEALSLALRHIIAQWDKSRSRATTESSEGLDEVGARLQLIADELGPLETTAPNSARSYVQQLAAALSVHVAATALPPVVEVDAPGGWQAASNPGDHTTSDVNQPEDRQTAPVVVASLARMDLARSLVRANGGILILSAADLVDRDHPSNDWLTLRSALRTGSIPMHGTGEPSIPLNVRVALVGSYAPFRHLERAEEFLRYFRYKARFEESAPWTVESEAAYAALTDGIARIYSIPPFDRFAIATLIEEGARRAIDRNRSRLTTDIVTLRDIAVEAGNVALAASRAVRSPDAEPAEEETLAGIVTSAKDVKSVLTLRRNQQSIAFRDAQEAILTGREIVATNGAAIGQINGLGVTPVHPVEGRYATPFRITAAVSPGRERLVDIEREADVADPSHISGALTMAGYLAWRYGQLRPISVVARLRFEQEHGFVSGPSASAAELFALLSALSRVPIRASIAVTGAVGQHGELQVVGGVNEKIEGFWQICRERRERGEQLDGDSGVIMPSANVRDIMLRGEIADEIIEGGWFHIWPIANIDEGLPLLMGVSAADVHGRVERQLQRFYEIAQQQPQTR